MKCCNKQVFKSPKIAFVSEAPRADGASWKIFRSLLRTAEIDLGDHKHFHVVNEVLENDEIGTLCADTKTARAEGFAEIPPIGAAGYLCSSYYSSTIDVLRSDLRSYLPDVVVPLGSTALWALCGTAAIGQNRGAVQASSLIEGYKVLPTIDPKTVMQQWKWYSVVVGDFLKAVKEAERGPEIIYPKRRLILEPTLLDIREFTKKALHSAKILSADIETGWGQITCIGFAPTTEDAICIPFVDIRKPNKSYWKTAAEEVDAWNYVKALLESDISKLGQNYAAYDAFWLLAKKGICTMNLLHDTRLLHHALYPELPKDLAFLGASYTQQGPWKTWGYSAKTKRDD